MEYRYSPKGVCSKEMIFNIENNKAMDLKVVGGCNGNLKGISSLIIGMDIDTIINKLKGIKCNFKETFCPDKIAVALTNYKKEV